MKLNKPRYLVLTIVVLSAILVGGSAYDIVYNTITARTSIELGSAADTTITSPAAGRLQVEGVEVAKGTPTDSHIPVGDGTTFSNESGATLRTSIGVGTGDSPQFTGVQIVDEAALTDLEISTYSDTLTHYSRILFGHSYNDTESTMTETPTNTELGSILFRGVDDASTWQNGARITVTQDGVAGTGEVPSEMAIETYSSTAVNTNQVFLDGPTGWVGLGTQPVALLDIGGATGTGIDGTDDIAVAGDGLIEGELITKAGPVFNVKAYGAIPDDATDDSTAIQAAIDAVGAAGGGYVFIPGGRYDLTTTLNPVENMTVYGIGRESQLHVTDVNAFTYINVDTAVRRTSYEQLRITAESGTAAYAFWIEGTGLNHAVDMTLDRVYCDSVIGGIAVEEGGDLTKLNATRCRFIGSTQYGFWCEGGSGSELNAIHFEDTWFDQHTLGAVYSGTAMKYSYFENCVFESNQSQYTVYVTGGPLVFDSSLFFNNGIGGAHNPGADVYIANGLMPVYSFRGCNFTDPNDLPNPTTWYGIYNAEPDIQLSVTGNRIDIAQGNYIGFLYDAAEGIDNVLIENNIVEFDGEDDANDLITSATGYTNHTIQRNSTDHPSTFNVPDCVVHAVTTDNTTTEVWGGTYYGPFYNFPDVNSVGTYEAEVTAVQDDSTSVLVRKQLYVFNFEDMDDASKVDVTEVMNTTSTYIKSGSPTTSFSITNDETASAGIKYTVRGENGKTIHWTVRIKCLGAAAGL